MTQKIRCTFCRKKLGLISFDCKCGGKFCSKHRYTHMHECTYKEEQKVESKEKIEKSNPKTESTTLVKID